MNSADNVQEARFDLDELFFSITTHDSTIVACNETFIRISEYDSQEIIGSYHNLIRHPSMPKVIFKTLWDYLLDNKPVAAYVKNSTKSGGYYWVLAAVFPVKDQFLSIRIKPSSEIFVVVQKLYDQLLEAQNEVAMEGVEALMQKHLQELGYRDYDHFMNSVLLTELRERQKGLMELTSTQKRIKHGVEVSSSPMQGLYKLSQELQNEYMQWFDAIERFESVKEALEEKSHILRTVAWESVLLSLNASVASYKMEAEGETFGVLARDVRAKAKENAETIEGIYETTKDLSAALESIIFLISYLSLQMDMVSYFINEQSQKGSLELDASVDTLISLVEIYNNQLMATPELFDEVIAQSMHSLESLETQVMYLGYIQVYGVIEASRLLDDKQGFKEIFGQLKQLINTTSEGLIQMRQVSEAFKKENIKNRSEFIYITKLLNSFMDEVHHIRFEEVA